MAYLAQLENDLIVQIIVVDDTIENREQFSQELHGGEWKEIRADQKFPIVGGKYLKDVDVFIAPQPFESWKLNSSYEWQAPKPYPNDDLVYEWNEDLKEWSKFDEL